MATDIVTDPVNAIDQLTNKSNLQTQRDKYLANRVARFYQDTSKLFPHTFFSDFTEEQCLASGHCFVGGAA